MQSQYIKMNQIIMKSIKQLTPKQYQQLLEGNGKLVFEELEQKQEVNNTSEVEPKLLDQYKETVTSFESKDEAYKYLMNFKKKQLINMAKHLDIRVLSSDTKAKLSNKIIGKQIGLKIRKKVFDTMKIENE